MIHALTKKLLPQLGGSLSAHVARNGDPQYPGPNGYKKLLQDVRPREFAIVQDREST